MHFGCGEGHRKQLLGKTLIPPGVCSGRCNKGKGLSDWKGDICFRSQKDMKNDTEPSAEERSAVRGRGSWKKQKYKNREDEGGSLIRRK